VACWETVAELVHEIRTAGPYWQDALHLLTEQINETAEISEILCQKLGTTHPLSSSLVLSQVHEIDIALRNISGYQNELIRIFIDKLRNARDA